MKTDALIVAKTKRTARYDQLPFTQTILNKTVSKAVMTLSSQKLLIRQQKHGCIKALGQIRTFKPPTLIFDVLGPSRVPRSVPQCCGHQHGFLQYLQDSVFGTL